MTLNQLSRILHLTNRTVRDINAVKRGRGVERIGNRVIGRLLSGMMRGRWL